jgi:hypothetical protein
LLDELSGGVKQLGCGSQKKSGEGEWRRRVEKVRRVRRGEIGNYRIHDHEKISALSSAGLTGLPRDAYPADPLGRARGGQQHRT